MAFTSGQSPVQRKSRQARSAGDRTLTAVGLACVGVVVLCAVAAKSDADNQARAYVATYTAGFGEGRHTVGEDVSPGTYVSEGAKSAGTERCSVTTERVGGGAPRVKAVNRGERVVVTLGRDVGAVTVRGCQDFARRDLDR